MGLYRNEQGGCACLALLNISLGLHQCQRSHRQYNVYREGTITANREETQSMQCNIMMHDHDMATCWCFELMQLTTKLNEVGLNPKFKSKLHM